MRLDIDRIIVSHRLDPSRKELCVEGMRDKSFLDWLIPVQSRSNASILLVQNVEIPDVTDGGERSRLLALLRAVEAESIALRGLIDADSHRLGGGTEPMPSNVWLTDLRDLESYVISVENIKTALQLGFARDSALGPGIYSSMVTEARWLAAIRLASVLSNLKLPVSEQKWLRYASCDRYGVVQLDHVRVLRLLIQSAYQSLRILDELIGQVQKLQENLAAYEDRDVVHGKDAVALVTIQFKAIGCNLSHAGPILWSTFRSEHVGEFPILTEIVAYLKS